MFIPRGDRDLGLAYQTHPGNQASSCLRKGTPLASRVAQGPAAARGSLSRCAAGTHGRGRGPRRCCPGSHCPRRTSSAPGCSGCWSRQTRQAGTGVGARRMGSLRAPPDVRAPTWRQELGQLPPLGHSLAREAPTQKEIGLISTPAGSSKECLRWGCPNTRAESSPCPTRLSSSLICPGRAGQWLGRWQPLCAASTCD